MRPAAVLSAIVKVQGIKSANVALYGLQGQLVKTDAASTAAMTSSAKYGKYLKGGLAVAAVAGAYAIGKAAKAGTEFNARLDTTQAVLKASGKQMEKLRKQALQFGETTVFSANNAAEAQKELAKGGLSVEQIYKGGLKSALYLAAAGEVEFGESAEYMANAMNLFNLSGKEAEQVANALAIAANDTTAEVSDFGMALRQGGGVAKLVGYNLQETVTTLEALAEAGIKNSDAGTSMKSALIQILKPSKKQAETAAEYNIELFKQNGAMKSAVGISKELHDELGSLERKQRANVIATLAGSDGVRTLNALWEAGPKHLKKLEAKLEQEGYAKEVAAEKTDNLKGDLSKLGNQFEAAGIKLETLAEPIARDLVQALDSGVEAIMRWDLSGFIDEVGDAYETLHEYTTFEIPMTGLQASLFPNIDSEITNLEIYKEASVDAFEWTQNAARNSAEAIVDAEKWVVGAVHSVSTAVEDTASWFDRAYHNVTGFVTSLLPVKVGLVALYVASRPVISFLEFLGAIISGTILPILKRFASFLSDVIVAAFEVTWQAIQTLLKFIGNLASVFADVVAVITNLLRGDWAGAWRAALRLVEDVWHTIVDLIKGAWSQIKVVFQQGIRLVVSLASNGFGLIKELIGNAADIMKTAFKGPWENIEDLFNTGLGVIESVVDTILDVIELIPGVDIRGSKSAREKAAEGTNKHGGETAGLGKTKRAMGGIVKKRQLYEVGEEAPQHHEWVIATNPAYKKANMGYWAAAGADLGVPGFAKGGLANGIPGYGLGGLVEDVLDVGKTAAEYSPPGLAFKAGKAGLSYGEEFVKKGAGWLIDQLPDVNVPFPLEGVGPYMLERAENFIKSWFGSDAADKLRHSAAVKASEASSGGVPGYTGPPADMKNLGDNAWVDSHTLAVANYLAEKFGLSISSGWRSVQHNEEVGGVANSLHTHGSAGNPGAIDFVPPSSAALAWATSHIAGIEEALIHDVGSGLHLHLGFFKKGGLLSEFLGNFAEGGFVEADSTQKKIALHVARNLIGRGLDYKGASGVVGNAWQESKWTPGIIGGGGRGFWGFDYFEAELIAQAEAQGVPWSNIDYQTDFMWSGPEPGSRLKGALNAQSSAASATELFDREWEKSGIKEMPNRIAGAHEVMNLLGQAEVPLGEAATKDESPHEKKLRERKEDAEKLKREGKHRKEAREKQLEKLENAVGEVKTPQAQRNKLWHLASFWGRNGMFDKGERGEFLQYVREAAAAEKPKQAVGILRKLANFAKHNGEITGKDPDNWRDLTDAIEKAKDQGADKRKKTIEKHNAKKERIRNKKIASIEARGEFPGLLQTLEDFRSKADSGEEYAGQLSAMEPDDLTDEYVKKEVNSWETVLDQLGSWRNTAISDKDIVNQRLDGLRRQKDKIESYAVWRDKKRWKKLPKWTKKELRKLWENNKYKIDPLKKAIESATAFRDETLKGEVQELSPQTMEGIIGTPISREAVAGMFGGRIFDVQNTIRELQLTDLTKPADNAKKEAEEAEKEWTERRVLEAAEAKAALEAERALDWKKRYTTLAYQSEVLKRYPPVQDLGNLPGFALGGMPTGPSWVGERGKELLFPSPGSRVVSAADSSQIAREGQGTTVVIQNLIVNEDGTADIEMPDGSTSTAEVRNVTRKQSREAMTPTPGGTFR